MSDTPETDAQASVGLENADRECVPADFARKLERERDEAIAARKSSVADWLGQIEQANTRVSRALQQVAMAEQERDEAREALRLTQAAWVQSKAERVKAIRERDEARAWVSEIFRLLDLPDGDMGALENCKQELEAARRKLSGIYRWIERRHQDGFLDSLTHEQNLDRVYDALYDRLDEAEQLRRKATVRSEYYRQRYEQLKDEREAAK